MTPTCLRAHHFAGLEPGSRLIVLGAVHGNEVAGTRGITRVLAELERGDWQVQRGGLTLVPVTNPLAYSRGTREGDRNLNRALEPVATPRHHEDRIANLLCPWLRAHDVLLDLHSFRRGSGAFVMRGPPDNRGRLEPFAHAAAEARLAAHLGPVRIVDGWLGAYARGAERRRQLGLPGDTDPRWGVGTTEYMRRCGGYGVTLECGQHDDPNGPEVAYRAIHQAVALLGIAPLPLQPPARDFECLTLQEVVDRRHEGDRFVRDWVSFDAVEAGQPIGHRHDGTPVLAPQAGRIVFPDATARPGREWFYRAVPSRRPLL